MFGFSKSLKLLNNQPSIVVKAEKDGIRKRHSQIMKPVYQPVKKPTFKFDLYPLFCRFSFTVYALVDLVLLLLFVLNRLVF